MEPAKNHTGKKSLKNNPRGNVNSQHPNALWIVTWISSFSFQTPDSIPFEKKEFISGFGCFKVFFIKFT